MQALFECALVSEGAAMRDLSVIVRMAEQGMSRQEIADALGISMPTLREHLTNIYRTLGYTGGKGKFKRLQERVKQKGAA